MKIDNAIRNHANAKHLVFEINTTSGERALNKVRKLRVDFPAHAIFVQRAPLGRFEIVVYFDRFIKLLPQQDKFIAKSVPKNRIDWEQKYIALKKYEIASYAIRSILISIGVAFALNDQFRTNALYVVSFGVIAIYVIWELTNRRVRIDEESARGRIADEDDETWLRPQQALLERIL